MDPSQDKEDIDDDASIASHAATPVLVADIISKASTAAVEVTLENESKASHAATPNLVEDIIRKASSAAIDVTLANEKAAMDSLDDGEEYLSLSLDGSSMSMAEPSQIEDAGVETEPVPVLEPVPEPESVSKPPPTVESEEEIIVPLITTTVANDGIDAELSTQLDGGFSTVDGIPSANLGPLPSDSISTFGAGVNGALESDSDLIENMVAATMSETEKLIIDPLPEPVAEINNDEQPQEQQPSDEEEKFPYNDETFDTLSPIKTADKGNQENGEFSENNSNNNNNNNNNDSNNDNDDPPTETIRTADSEIAYGDEGFEDASAPPRYTLTTHHTTSQHTTLSPNQSTSHTL